MNVRLNTSPGAKDDGPKSATNTFKLVHPEIVNVVTEVKSVVVGVGVFVGVSLGVPLGVSVIVGVGVLVGVSVFVGVLVGVSVFVGVLVGVGVGVGNEASQSSQLIWKVSGAPVSVGVATILLTIL